MGDKTTTADALQFPEIQLQKPCNKTSLGRYRLPRLPDVDNLLARFNVYKYEGDKPLRQIEPDDNDDDYDERDEPVVTVPGGIKALEDFENEEDDIISEEEAKFLHFEKHSYEAGVWCTTIECPVDLFKFLIGSQGNAKLAFETEYSGVTLQFVNPEGDKPVGASDKQQLHRRIWLPKHNGTIVLRHDSSRRTLLTARENMESKIAANMTLLPYTHFISLPLLSDDNDEVVARFRRFKDRCMAICDPVRDRVEESLFMPPGQMHFTLCMLRLYYEDQVRAACDALKSLPNNARISELFRSDRPEHVPSTLGSLPPGLHLRLRGVLFMGDDASTADVLYTTEAEGRDVTIANEDKCPSWINFRRSARTYIISLCQELYQCLCDKGVMDWQELERQRLLNPKGDIDLNLHATLMNTKLRSPTSPLLKGSIRQPDIKSSASSQIYVPRLPFNASRILREFTNFDFGVARILGLHLSVRGTPASDTHYYKPEVVIPIRPKFGL
eukprot:Gregarina_sp_Poly_1__9750@NODE_620_length_7097_cov_138_674395_g475_i0_p2_GENE_NODE_620_length_7097_cov_138_674395_g475_i0NODE_620_length_7097_cov_138_674395_g475_i0_p2_ORF_typecomplete_len499_score61_10AKAP7_NLS/PF10469_9/7_7e30_NODE_620_length_7097_cov_138_674395_g475_i019263422